MKDKIQKLIDEINKGEKNPHNSGVVSHLQAAITFLDNRDKHFAHMEKRKKEIAIAVKNRDKIIADAKKQADAIKKEKLKKLKKKK